MTSISPTKSVNEILDALEGVVPEEHFDDPQVVGKRLKFLRELNGMTQKDVARGVCTAAYLCRLELGRRNPSLQILYKLAIRLYTGPRWLSHGEGHYNDPPTIAINALCGTNGARWRLAEEVAELRKVLVATTDRFNNDEDPIL